MGKKYTYWIYVDLSYKLIYLLDHPVSLQKKNSEDGTLGTYETNDMISKLY